MPVYILLVTKTNLPSRHSQENRFSQVDDSRIFSDAQSLSCMVARYVDLYSSFASLSFSEYNNSAHSAGQSPGILASQSAM